MNKVFLIGNLTKDPELKLTSSSIPVCTISIAVNKPFSAGSGEREADFFNIVTWRGLAENCSKYLKKGNKVAVFGYLQTRSYDGNDGQKRYVTEIVAEDVEFLTPKSASEGGGSYERSAPVKKSIRDNEPVEDDQLPF